MNWTLPKIYETNPNEGTACGAAQGMLTALVDGLKEYKIIIKPVDYLLGAATVTLRFRLGETVLKNGNIKKMTAQMINTRMLDVARILHTNEIRFVPVISGTDMLAIEAPRPDRQTVFFKDMLPGVGGGNLTFPVGLDTAGGVVYGDIAKMPHLLVAGATGSGKSVAINTIISSLISRNTPDDVQLLLLDPKVVEFMPLAGLPHLVTKGKKIITDIVAIVNALESMVGEMEKRYQLLAEAKCRNIGEYRAKGNKMPYVVVVIDEFADIFMQAGKEFETAISRLAGKARAAGIHLILGTQRPSADVVSGVIKANITARWAFTTTSKFDSLTILGEQGAESLLGRGDALYSENGKPIRAQCPLVTDEEIDALVEHWRAQTPVEVEEEVEETQKVVCHLEEASKALEAGNLFLHKMHLRKAGWLK